MREKKQRSREFLFGLTESQQFLCITQIKILPLYKKNKNIIFAENLYYVGFQ